MFEHENVCKLEKFDTDGYDPHFIFFVPNGNCISYLARFRISRDNVDMRRYFSSTVRNSKLYNSGKSHNVGSVLKKQSVKNPAGIMKT